MTRILLAAFRTALAPLGVALLSWDATAVLAAFFADVAGATLALSWSLSAGSVRDVRDLVAKIAIGSLMTLLLSPLPAIVLAWLYSVARALAENPVTDWLARGGAPGAIAVGVASFVAAWRRNVRTDEDLAAREQALAARALVPLASRAAAASFVAIGCWLLRARLGHGALLALVSGVALVAFVLDVLVRERASRGGPD